MIPAIQEVNFPPYATLHQATVSLQDMGDRVISTQVRIDGDVVPDFSGWELKFKGERFVLPSDNPQASKDNTTRNSIVDLQFQSWVIQELKRYYFFEAASVSAGVAIADKYVTPVRLNVEDFVAMLNQVLKYYFGDTVVADLYMSGQGQYSTEPKVIEINYSYLWDVIGQIYEIYGVRYRIDYNSTTGVYTIKFGWPTTDIDITDHDFEYGYKGGLLKFERQVQDETITNILLGRGGEKNLPYRYFKLKEENAGTTWEGDPDAIPELKNIYFDRLRDINFRWYVRGWMHNPSRDTSGDEAWDPGHVFPTYEISSDSPYYWAYQKGLTDTQFNPVEFVKDDSSIEAYGERWGAADDNDEIYPTIQGRSRNPIGRIDEVVAVSPIVTDDIDAMAAASAVEKSIDRMVVTSPSSNPYTIDSDWFEIPTGQTGNIRCAWVGPTEGSSVTHIATDQSSIVAIDANGTEHPISGLSAGRYKLHLSLKLYVPSGHTTAGQWGLENIVLTTSAQDANAWKPTFDIWVKNIWGTQFRDSSHPSESPEEYAARVWEEILGDRAGNEAKVVFSTGFMSVSEDYEFVIASYPVYDTSKNINGVPSEWRITLRKSDAEYEATGLYIPNATTGGKPVAGDKFFFTGIDMPFLYVTLGEEDLNTNKSSQLEGLSVVNPTWVISLDKVRVHTLEDGEYGQTLADRLAAGAKLRITDPRFSGGDILTLYAQSITYTWNEPSENSPYIVPDIEVVLSDKVVSRQSRADKMESSIQEIRSNYARLDDVERVVRSVAEPMFLKKTGEADSSDSPTQFSSKVSSKGFRQGGVGGNGWGFYRDNTKEVAEGEEGEGDSVLEIDRIVVRKELEVNSLVVNQAEYRGGREIQSAAQIECTKVVVDDSGKYVCYFDQKQGSVKNLFVVGDFAYSTEFAPDNTVVKYYRRRVDAVDVDRIVLSDTVKDGAGVPAAGDVIIQYGHESNTARQYVIVRDVIGGGYERMISGLSTVSTNGEEYYFAGRQTGQYYDKPRWFVGDSDGEYAEYLNGILNIKGRLQVLGESGSYSDLGYLADALPKKGSTLVQGGLILTSMIQLGQVENSTFKVYSGINGKIDTSLEDPLETIAAWYGGPMVDHEASPSEANYARSLFRMNGSGYLAGGNIHWDENGYGGIPGISWSRPSGSQNDVITIGADVMLESTGGADSSVTDLITLVRSLSNMFEDESYTEGGQTKHRIKVKSGFEGLYTNGYLSAGGISSGGGSSAVDLQAVWASLEGNDGYGAGRVIDSHHIPDMASVYGYLKSADLDGYATDEDLDDVEDLLQAQIDSLASRDRFDELMATSFYADVIAANDIFGYLHGTADAAAKLTTSGALNIWGVQYWNNGVPVAVTGRPELYIARTRVNNVLVNDTLLGIDAISNASSSGSSDQSRIVWEPNAGGDGVGAWHFLGNVYADGFISSGGLSQGGGQPAGNASLSDVGATSFAHGKTGKVSASGVGDLVLYDKDAVDYLIDTGGKVKKVAGVDPDSNGNIPLANLTSALGVGSVASGNSGLVTGGTVYSYVTDVLSSALKFQGTTTTALSDGSTTNPITINGSSYTAKRGDVVLYDGKEYLWTSSAWEQLGDEASWALKTTTISAGTGLTGGGSLAANRTISLSQATIDSLALANSAYQKPSGGIPNSDLANSAITIGSTSISLGGSTSVLAGLTSVTSQKFYLDSDNYFEIVDGKVHLHVGTNGGFYTEGFVSAGGVSSGGGASSIDLAAMWASLQNNHNVDTYNAYKFAIAHLPSVGAGLTLTQSGTAPNLVTTLGIDSANYHLPTANEWANIAVIEAVLDNLQAQIDSVSSRDRFDELLATDAFMDTLSASSIYAEAIELNGANLATTLAGKQDSISDLATIRSRADEGHTAYGYFSSGLLPWAKVNVGANDIVGTLGTTAVNRATADASGNTISTTYATITALNSVSGRVTTLESRTNWDTYFGVDEDGNVYVKMNGENARGFYSYGFVSAGGASSGGGSASVDLVAVWQTLTNTSTDHTYDSTKLAAAHVPDMASVYGYVKSVSIAEGATDGTIHIVVDGTAGSDVSVHGLGSAAFVSSSTFASASHTHTKSQITDFPTTWAWASITGAPSTMPNPFALTFGSKTYDGSEAKTITASDLGALTSHQSVTLAGGTNNYTMKLTTAAGTTDNVAVTGLAGAIDALQSQIDSIGSRDRFDELMATDFFADQLEASVAYVESVYGALIGNASTATDADKLDGQHGSYYATASSVSTLQGYFDSSGNAKSALKLTAVSKTAWGQTFWTSGGVPDSISGNMSSVGSISMNGSISGATTIEASTSVKAPKLYLDANTYFEVDSNGNVHLVVDSANGKGFYTEGFISAGGVSGGGGASGLDETAMWAALQRNSGVGLDKKLHYAHLPACGSGLSYTLDNSGIATAINVSFPVSSVAGKTGVVTLAVADITDIESWISGKGYITSASIPSTYAWSAITGTPTTLSGYGITDAFLASNFTAANIVSTLGTTAVNRATADASGNTITSTYATKTALANAEDALWRGVSSVGAKDRFDELNASVFFSDVITGTTAYIETINGTLKGNADSATNATKLNGQSASYYAMASSLNGYLLLSGGSMTGLLKIATGKGIEDATGNGMLCYHPSSWTGVSSSQWGAGAIDCQGVIRSSASDLIHYRGNAAYVIWDSANDGSGSGLDADTVDGEHSSAFAHRGTANNLLVAGNEFNFISAGFSGDVYLNYQDENRQSAALVSGYNFCNGRGSTFAYIGASGSSFGANVSVTGNIAATGAITAGSASDARLKDDVRNLAGAVELIMALRPVSFKWNGKATELYEGYRGEDLGFIAQEVEPLLPMAISSIFERYKRLDQNKIIAPLVSVAQSHENRIRALERKVEFLEAENRRLRERLTN